MLLITRGKSLLFKEAPMILGCQIFGKYLGGGKVEEQQNLTESLEREVYEECGLIVSPTNRIGYFESTIATSAKYKGHTVVSIIGIAICEKDKIRLSPEHQTFAWLDLKDFSQLNLIPQVAKALEILEPEIKKTWPEF